MASLMVLAGLAVAQPVVPKQDEPKVTRDNAGAIRRINNIQTGTRSSTIRGKLPVSSYVREGVEAPQYRYIVGISYLKNGREGVCTGTLINKRLVLTAAHCGCGTSYSVTQELDMKDGKAIPVAEPPILFDSLICQRSAIRPGYDLALLRLSKDAEVDHGYKLIPQLAYSTADFTRTGTDLTVVGYGLTEKRTSGVRLEASVPVFTADCAQRQYVAAGCAPFLEMILSASARTIGSRTADTCSGDSGGPVFAMMPSERGLIPTLVAITSRPAPIPHIDATNHCGGGGFYIVVGRTDVLTWLTNNGAENVD